MNKIIKFFVESRQELSKVIWPTRKQAQEMTLAVVIIVLVVGFYLGAVDFVLTKALTLLLNK